jgi:dTDP-4-amino-4,6-dideoxygalactose transaminase/dTDP-4-dehydrorhamnose 3,5-epimerase-like enzyme
MDSSLIQGVLVTPQRRIHHPKGDILHALKRSGDGYVDFGEAYFSNVHCKEVKGWKRHRCVTLNLVVPVGKVRFVIYDDRKESDTHGSFMEVTLGDEQHARLTVSPGLWVAFQGLGTHNLLLNIADEEHDPTEADNIDLAEIPFSWRDRGAESIRLSKSVVGEEEKNALARVIDAGYLGMGREVQQFEEELRAYISTDHEVICVNTGTAALHIAIGCLGIGPGDEVLVPSITYVASFQAVSAAGAKPVACDVTADRVFIDLDDAARRLTPSTRAIMPVHYASDSTEMAQVYDFAARHGLRVIEDAAHGFGCERNGKKIGAEGDVICFSFDGIKNITSGEGGAVITGDKVLAQRIRDARLLGVEKDTEKRYSGQRSWLFDVHQQGYRYHMSNLMAAIGRAQLAKLSQFAEVRRRAVTRYREELSHIPAIQFLDLNYHDIISHIFVVRVITGRRNELNTFLRDHGIECGMHYQPNHCLDYFTTPYSLPVSELLADQLLSLPLHADLNDAELAYIIRTVSDFFEHRASEIHNENR